MQNVTLDTIGGGALPELFAAELARVLANIADPNTKAESKREIAIKVTFAPKADRDVADVSLVCSSKLAGIVKVSTTVFMGKQAGKLVAVENDPRQSTLFDDPSAKPQLAAVASMKGGE
jgi:hypothetical protein